MKEIGKQKEGKERRRRLPYKGGKKKEEKK